MDAMNDRDFRAVATEVYQQYHEAVEHWERVEWVLRDQRNDKDRGIVRAAEERIKHAKSRVMAVLGTITEIDPGDRVRASIPGLQEEAAKRR